MTAAPRRPALHIGQILDRRRVLYRNSLISLVLPRGIEPLFSP
jgi:hypothetical protein